MWFNSDGLPENYIVTMVGRFDDIAWCIDIKTFLYWFKHILFHSILKMA